MRAKAARGVRTLNPASSDFIYPVQCAVETCTGARAGINIESIGDFDDRPLPSFDHHRLNPDGIHESLDKLTVDLKRQRGVKSTPELLEQGCGC
jgi:hypothetical protein